jgi:hypothetical protein
LATSFGFTLGLSFGLGSEGSAAACFGVALAVVWGAAAACFGVAVTVVWGAAAA